MEGKDQIVFQIYLILGKGIFFSEKLYLNQEFSLKQNYEWKKLRNSINRFKSERSENPELFFSMALWTDHRSPTSYPTSSKKPLWVS